MFVVPNSYEPCDFASHIYMAMRHQRRLAHEDLGMKLRLFHSPGPCESMLVLNRADATVSPALLARIRLRRRVYALWNGCEFDLILIDHRRGRRGVRVSLCPRIIRGKYDHLIPREVKHVHSSG